MPATTLKSAFPLKTLQNEALLAPPAPGVPITDPTWTNWFYRIYAIIGQSGGGIFPKLTVGNTSFTGENAQQALLTINQGLYVNYSTSIGNICYGYACNVYRSGGTPFVVGAQINAWQTTTGGSGVFGIACTAVANPNTGTTGMTGIEPDIANFSSANMGVKWGVNSVFKDRFDGAATVTEGLGSNLYNYSSCGYVLTAQSRSGTGEFCGWAVGLQFLDQWCDQYTAPAWSSAVTYQPGQVVTSGGALWKTVVSNTNSAPSGANSNWIQFSSGTTPLAVGIDFSPVSTTTMGRMASAIRLRNTMLIHWEETGAVGTRMDSGSGVLRLCENGGALRFGVNVGTGITTSSQSITAAGGGAAATNPTIGGSGPGTAAAQGWAQFVFNGVTYFIPVWR